MKTVVPATWMAALRAAADRGRARLERIDAIPAREKGALAALVLAGLAAAEFGWVLPQRDRHGAVVAAAVAEQQARQQAEQDRRDQLAQERSAIEWRLATVEVELARRGAASPRSQSLGAWMQSALAGQALRMVALRDAGVSEIEAPASMAVTSATNEANAAGGNTPPAGNDGAASPRAADAPDSSAVAQPTLYRHRYELTLAGNVEQLAVALQVLAERLAPLRIERVRFHTGEGGTVQATLGFVIVTSERTWIAL